MALKSGRVGIHPSQVDPITGMLLNGPTPGSVSFEDLSDAQITDPEVGQTLQYNGTGWQNVFASISPTTLANLQDVQITDPEDGAYLVYDAENNKWINSTTPPTPVVPEGSTVTPTDDIQTWLACAGITDKTYITLNEVLADSTALLALMSSNNAVDYLVRSTIWASGVTADSTAMTDIGANNYCADTLLGNSTWLTAICNSTYFESVLSVKVPTMTSDTTPSGTCGANSSRGDRPAYYAFDGNDTTFHTTENDIPIEQYYLGYEFPSSHKIYKVSVLANSYNTSNYYDIAVYGGNSLTTMTNKLSGNMKNQAAQNDSKWLTDSFACPTAYTCFGLKIVDSNQTTSNGTSWWNGIVTLQFYGR